MDETAGLQRSPLIAVLALDGSACSDTALALASSLHWPRGSTVRAVSVVDALPQIVAEELPTALRETVEVVPADIPEIEAALTGRGQATLRVERLLRTGRPASEIVREAKDCAASLIMLGSRGHGTIETSMLGSVSAEVVEQAPCSVLVARGEHIGRVLLADDGSDYSRAAVALLLDGTLFRDAEIRVISVASAPLMLYSGIAPTLYRQAMEGQADAIAASTAEHEAIARRTTDRLCAAGYRATSVVPVGAAAAEIVRYAKGWADLIILGTHGRTGLRRVLLGSVARSVLLHAHCSVMIARPPQQAAAGAHPAR